jgi:phage-related protein (TIGR01555 family)
MNLVEAMQERQDDWQNTQLGMGGGTKDLSAQTRYGIRAAIDDYMLEAMFVEDHFAAAIIGAKISEAMRPGWDLVVPGEPSEAARVRDAYAVAEQELDVRGDMAEGAAWGRLFGGALTWIGADDGSGDPATPLDESAIKAVRFVHTYDRRQVQIQSYYTDPLHASFGLPEMYRITPVISGGYGAGAVMVHESRVVRWGGQPTTDTRRQSLGGWDDSVLERCWDALKAVGENYSALSLLMQRISQAVYKIKGLWSMLAGKDKERLFTRLSMLDATRSRARGLALDTEEDFVNVTTPVGGVELLIDRGVLRVAACAEMPATVLMRQAPSGLNSTGAADLELWYASVEQWRSLELLARHERIARLILLSQAGPTGGVEPETWRIEYRPLRMPTAIERATLRKTQAETDAIEIDKGIIPPEAVALARHTGMGADEIVKLDEAEVTAALERRRELAKAPPKDNAELGTVGARAGGGQMDIIERVATGRIPRESGVAILVQTFRLTPEDAEVMIGPVDFKPAAKAEPPAAFGQQPATPQHGFGAGAPQPQPGQDQGGRPKAGE